MIRKSQNLPSVVFSVRVYQLLLKAYPTKFQQEYGLQMVQVFQDCCLRAVRQGGPNGMIRLWAITLLDFLRSVLEQHMQKESDLSKSTIAKLSGWAFILGSFAFITILSGSDPIAIPGSEISAILLAVGLLGLRARYGEQVGGFGRNILLLGASGPLLLVIVVAMGLSGILTETQITKGLWILLFGGPAVVLLGLTLFGLTALRNKPMSRLNWLPVFAGIWYPVIYCFLAVYILTHNGTYPQQFHSATQMMLAMQSIVLCVLGFVLATDTLPEEMTTA